jgi:RNA polymerase sigma factor (sigma-70 family)
MAYYTKNDDISYELPSRAEEKALFAVYHAGGPDALAARDKLVIYHLKLVAKLAIQSAKRALDDDLAISAGNMGLMQALESKKFDPSRNLRFATYLRSYVRGQVFAAMKANHLEYTVSTDAGGSQSKDLSEDVAMTGTRRVFALHTPVVEEAIEHESEALDLTAFRRAAILKASKKLNLLEEVVVRMNCLNGIPLSHVAKTHGVARQACQQAKARALRKLYALLSPTRHELI